MGCGDVQAQDHAAACSVIREINAACSVIWALLWLCCGTQLRLVESEPAGVIAVGCRSVQAQDRAAACSVIRENWLVGGMQHKMVVLACCCGLRLGSCGLFVLMGYSQWSVDEAAPWWLSINTPHDASTSVANSVSHCLLR